jgi:hypothetical protein
VSKKAGGDKKKVSAPKKAASASVGAALASAMTDRSLVRLGRRLPKSDRLDGFVVGLGTTWVLLALMDLNWMALDGFVAVRRADVTKVERRGDPLSFPARVLKKSGQWPPTAPDDIDLDHDDRLLLGAARIFALATVFNESDRPDQCLVGRIAGVTGGSLDLRCITNEAVWQPSTTALPLAQISRIGLGDRYQSALLAVGGQPPL